MEFRCEMTPGFLDQVEPELRAAMLARFDQVVPANWARLRPLATVIRLAGLAATAAGVGLAGYGIAVTPDAACTRKALVAYHVAMVVYVLLGTVFWFMPRINVAWAAWARGVAGRRVPSLLAPLRRLAPYTVEYTVGGGWLEARAAKLRMRRRIRLQIVRAAMVTPRLACLYRGRRSTWLRRVVYLPDAEARRVLVEALRAADAEVTELAVP